LTRLKFIYLCVLATIQTKMMKHQQKYIQQVQLKGYKSIQDLNIQLKFGLNIIIGYNGSGKTNFLDFLQAIVERNYWALPPNFYASIALKNNGLTQWNAQSFYKKMDKNNHIEEISNKFKHKILYPANTTHSFHLPLPDLLSSIGIFLKIGYNLPKNIPFLDIADNWTANKIIRFNEFSSFAHFMDSKSGQINTSFLLMPHSTIQELIENWFQLPDKILNYLKYFTPIQRVRLASGYTFEKNLQQEFDLRALIFEFLVNDKWLRWEQLSDGTKRLFYIIFEISYYEKGVFCVEEPELGIHPDQLHKLMDFLNLEAAQKQIIITTHSPEILNILEKKELDRIIITRYVPDQGTKMHKLSPHKIKKGQLYMEKVGHLSNFWVHSNLEEYEEN
jgi:predicted ATPase